MERTRTVQACIDLIAGECVNFVCFAADMSSTSESEVSDIESISYEGESICDDVGHRRRASDY